jgi:hypothetical protein
LFAEGCGDVGIHPNREIAAFLIAIPMLAFPIPAAPENPSKPNIVLAVMDNFGYGEVGVYGGGVLRGAATPRIDSLASEGLRITNYNVEAECTSVPGEAACFPPMKVPYACGF